VYWALLPRGAVASEPVRGGFGVALGLSIWLWVILALILGRLV